ncbi:inorganic phosphate transporter Pho88 [Phlyctochytrium arcticum]|nr:inorganic phosphate transporter Pho88 [Phlyctochytrium arcticum]
MALASQVTNLAVVFGLVQLANKLDLDNEANVNYLRVGYLGMQICVAVAYAIVYRRVLQKNDQSNLTFTEVKNPLSPQNSETVRTTVKDYDVGKLKELFRSQVTAMVILGFIHFKWGYLRPLLLQSVLGFRSLYQTQLVQIHLLGRPATGDLARPWKAASPFSAPPTPVTEKEIKAKDRKEAKKKLIHQE